MTNKIDKRIAALEAELAFVNKTALDMMEQRDELAAALRNVVDTFPDYRFKEAEAALAKLEGNADAENADS